MVIFALLIALGAAGCGSGGDGSTTAPASASGESPSGQVATGKKQEVGSGPQGQGARKGNPARSRHSNKAARERGKVGSKPPRGSGADRHSARVKRKLAKACPKGMSENNCRAYVEGSLKANQAKSTHVSRPRDCTKVMSRSQCEELLEQQRAAEQESSGVNVDQCMAHPTPHCEEVLGEEIERQQAAQQAGD